MLHILAWGFPKIGIPPNEKKLTVDSVDRFSIET